MCIPGFSEPPKSKSILRTSPKFFGPKRSVHFSKGTLHHVKIPERKCPSQGVIQHSEPHERSPYAPKFEDRPQEETPQQQRSARRDAWGMAKHVLKLQEKDKDTFHSLSEVWSSPAPIFYETRGRSSMHMLSRKDLDSAEVEPVRVSRNPTTVITVQINEEATVYVHDLELFVTVEIFEDTPAVLSLRKNCEDRGYSCEWASGQKPHLTKNGQRIQCNTENYVPVVVPSSSASTSPTPLPSPAATRSDSTSIPASGNRLRDPTETKNTSNKKGTLFRHRETGCEICQSG